MIREQWGEWERHGCATTAGGKVPLPAGLTLPAFIHRFRKKAAQTLKLLRSEHQLAQHLLNHYGVNRQNFV